MSLLGVDTTPEYPLPPLSYGDQIEFLGVRGYSVVNYAQTRKHVKWSSNRQWHLGNVVASQRSEGYFIGNGMCHY